MENNKEEVKQQPTNDLNAQLFQHVLKISQELNELRAQNKKKEEEKPQQTNSYHSDLQNMNLKLYNGGNTINVVNREQEQTKTIAELKEEAKKEMIQQRNNFSSNQIYGDVVSRSYEHGKNSRFYHECAFINIYEQADEKFREIVGPKMELLKKGDYWGLLNLNIQEHQALVDTYKGIEGHAPHKVSERQTKLEGLARNLIHKYNTFVNM